MSRRIAVALTAAAALVAAVFVVPAAFAESPVPQRLADQLANCQDMLKAAETSHEKAWAEDCVALAERAIAAVPAPSPTATASPTGTPTGSPTPPPTTVAPTTPAPTPTPTPPPTTTAAPTTVPPTTPPPTTPPPTPTWPGAATTGVPAGVTLVNYTRSCSVTVANTVIAGQLVNCDLRISAPGVSIVNSRINGNLVVVDNTPGTVVVTDSEVHATPGAPRQVTGVENHDFKLIRVEVTGGNRGVYCKKNCEIRDSWIHAQRVTSNWHASAVRMEQDGLLYHSTVLCDAAPTPQGGGCSADVTMYPDFAPVTRVTVEGNWFSPVRDGYWCAYGGNTQGKAYSTATANATYIVFKNNIFERGPFGKCGGRPDGSPITEFAKGRTGNVWESNRYDTGELISV